MKRKLETVGVTSESVPTCGWSLTPSALAFLVIRRCIRGLRICDRSSPPGVYVNGFLSFVIIAFCIAAGGSYPVPPLVSGI